MVTCLGHRPKFEMSSFTQSRNSTGIQRVLKGGHMTQTTPLWGKFIILANALIRLHTKFKVSSFIRSRDKRGSQILKKNGQIL